MDKRMVCLTYNGENYSTENSAYMVKNGLIIELDRLRSEQEKERILKGIINPYGPLYKPTVLEDILNDSDAERDSDLEELLRIQRLPVSLGDRYKRKLNPEELKSFLERTERIIEVDYLPETAIGRVLGMYDPNTDTIYVLKNLSPNVKRLVRAHEKAHRRRHFTGEPQDESLVDLEAAAMVGFDPLNRFSGTGYRIAA